MRSIIFSCALLLATVLETSAPWSIKWGLLIAVLINFSFSRTWSYIFLAGQVFLVAMLRLQLELLWLLIVSLLLLKLAELVTFHFSHSRDSLVRYLVGTGLVWCGYFIMFDAAWWHYNALLLQQLFGHLLLACLLWLGIKPFQRWLLPPTFAISAK